MQVIVIDERIHDHIASCGLLEKHVVIPVLYAKCGASSKVQRVLHDLFIRHVVSWSALIAGYAQQGHC